MRNARSILVVGACLVLIAGPSCDDRDDDNLRSDVLYCEDAVAHAKDCCGQPAVAGLECRYLHDEDSGCAGSRTEHIEPDLYLDESRCITRSSCEFLRGAGVCTRLLTVPRAGRRSNVSTPTPSSSGGTTGGTLLGHVAVCT